MIKYASIFALTLVITSNFAVSMGSELTYQGLLVAIKHCPNCTSKEALAESVCRRFLEQALPKVDPHGASEVSELRAVSVRGTSSIFTGFFSNNSRDLKYIGVVSSDIQIAKIYPRPDMPLARFCSPENNDKYAQFYRFIQSNLPR